MNKITQVDQVPPDKGYYIAGFVDGEGSFFMSARKRFFEPAGWRFELHFNISNRDLAVLEICRKYLGCGSVRETRSGFYTLEVEKKTTLAQFIIPFFRKFGFLSNKKKAEFRIFQQAFHLLEAGVKTREELAELLSLRKQLNELRNARIKNTDEVILESYKFVEESPETIR
jgi:LAGLIDADG endonuclease